MIHKIYVGSYSEKDQDGIFIFTFNDQTATLEKVGASSEVGFPSFLVESSGGLLFAVSETEVFAGRPEGAVAILERKKNNIALADIKPSGGAAPCHIVLSPDENTLFAANYGGGSIAVFDIDKKENKLNKIQLVQHHGRGPNHERQTAPHTHFCGFHGGRLYCADLGTDTIKCYNLENGRLTGEKSRDINMPSGSGVRHFVSSNFCENILISVCELSSELIMIDTSHTPAQIVQKTLATKYKGENYPAAIKQSISGEFVFVSNRGDNSITAFQLDKNTKQLRLVATAKTEGDWPRDFLLLGDYLVVANQNSDELSVLRFNAETSSLCFTGQKLACPKPACVILAG